VPQSLLEPQVEIWILVSPSWESHVPSGCAANAALEIKQNPVTAVVRSFISTVPSDLQSVPTYETQAERGRMMARLFGG
jgi:hypothetical protein